MSTRAAREALANVLRSISNLHVSPYLTGRLVGSPAAYLSLEEHDEATFLGQTEPDPTFAITLAFDLGDETRPVAMDDMRAQVIATIRANPDLEGTVASAAVMRVTSERIEVLPDGTSALCCDLIVEVLT